MLNLRSSHSASATSCTLRESVRSWVRNRFLASCWVSVEPPCDTPRRRMLATDGAGDADRVDAVVRIEAPVLDRDERLRHVARQVLERHRGAAHVAAGGEQMALQIDDLDRRRALGDFERLDRRQMGADPHHAADRGDDQPEADDRAPIGDASDGPSPAAATLAAAALASWGACRRSMAWRGAAQPVPPVRTPGAGSGATSNTGSRRSWNALWPSALPCPSARPPSAPATPRAESGPQLGGRFKGPLSRCRQRPVISSAIVASCRSSGGDGGISKSGFFVHHAQVPGNPVGTNDFGGTTCARLHFWLHCSSLQRFRHVHRRRSKSRPGGCDREQQHRQIPARRHVSVLGNGQAGGRPQGEEAKMKQ